MSTPIDTVARVSFEELERFVGTALRRAGANEPSADAATRALVGASLYGVDSHGVRLLPVYVTVLADGRVTGAPQMTFERKSPATGFLDADNGLGHYAGYQAIEHGIKLAEETGIAAVAVGRTTHFGPAGAYPLAAAERGYIALSCCNTDKLVLPFDGLTAFHGTNPIAFAAPVPGERPYLIDMATSPIPWNRVWRAESLGQLLPEQVAVDAAFRPTRDPAAAEALLPVGGPDYGYKGAALASLVEVLCAALTGMLFSFMVPDDLGPDFAEPRGLGQFYIVMRPGAFVAEQDYGAQMRSYLAALRDTPARPGTRVMAPGDREWAAEDERRAGGIPLDAAIWRDFTNLSERLEIDLPATLG